MNRNGAAETAAAAQESDTVFLRFGNEMFEPLASGALYWRARRTLLVADLHFEKFSSFARRGRMLPPYDTALTLRRLAADIALTGAAEVVALGDSFHRDEGVATLIEADRAQLLALLRQVRWTWLAGNHDPAPHALGGVCLPALQINGLTLAHEPRAGSAGLVAGHLHPAARLYINGRSVRRPCFVHDGQLLILPAYGASTGTLDITGPAFAGLLDWSRLGVVMVGRGRVYPVSPRRLVAAPAGGN